ncbi:MAG TPA: SsrA-binding protein SmpB [Candidatus Didemnitutus sp.]|nr:SsrA-binding protein SmpB [Candidatus Didemnitutus sp.]
MPDERTIRTIITNRKALHEFEVLQRFEAGIALTGTEVKSLRAGKVNMADAYATFPSRSVDELYLIGLHINPYDFGNRENHDPIRKRKLLLKAHELHRLRESMEEKGLTVVPLSLYFSGPYVKVELGLMRGKKLYDKRAATKERELQREMQRGRRDQEGT